MDGKTKIRRKNNIILWCLLILLALSVVYKLFRYREYIAGDLQMTETCKYGLYDQVNPNRASWAALACLPGVGQGKARAIVKYRQEYAKTYGSEQAVFQEAGDLCRVRGIGEKTVAQIEEYLIFD
ncbi:MAG: helix-hairpin-helix domain-containing protein [Sedimentisphaerales bacterium]|nr:helix-hairpin-helix domain-containing protein [Sedimentisphaerales bacterium]